jgi:CO/xanthine dehydrogenase Mo-binding subunit
MRRAGKGIGKPGATGDAAVVAIGVFAATGRRIHGVPMLRPQLVTE